MGWERRGGEFRARRRRPISMWEVPPPSWANQGLPFLSRFELKMQVQVRVNSGSPSNFFGFLIKILLDLLLCFRGFMHHIKAAPALVRRGITKNGNNSTE